VRGGHIPERSCVACGLKRPKRELVRIVRAPSGQVTADPSGKLPGRGAYICNALQCWEKALQGDRLAHVLKTVLAAQDRERLIAHAGQAPARTGGQPVVQEAS